MLPIPINNRFLRMVVAPAVIAYAFSAAGMWIILAVIYFVDGKLIPVQIWLANFLVPSILTAVMLVLMVPLYLKARQQAILEGKRSSKETSAR